MSVSACTTQVVKTENIECKFQRTDGYLFPESSSKEHMETLDKELAASIRCGLTDVRKVLHLASSSESDCNHYL